MRSRTAPPLPPPACTQVLHANGAGQSGRSVQSVIKLLKTGELKDCARVIVYCAYQMQAEEAAQAMKVHGGEGKTAGGGGCTAPASLHPEDLHLHWY